MPSFHGGFLRDDKTGALIVGGPMMDIPSLSPPSHLRRWHGALADALFAQAPIIWVGDSITYGQGADGVNGAGSNTTDAVQGGVGQLRSLFAKIYGDTGEGFIFNTDSRVTTTGAQTGANAYSGPLRHSTRLLNTQTFSITVPAGVATLSVIQANNSGDITATYTKNGGASTPLNALTGTGTSIVTDIAVAASDAIVISGPATAQTYIGGLILRNGTTGVPVHRVGVSGYVSGDMLGGQTSGVLNLTAGQQTSAIRKLYDWVGGPGLLIISFGVNDQNFQISGGSTAQNGVTLLNYTTWITQVVQQAVTDGWAVLLLGEPPNPNTANVQGGQESDYKAALASIAAGVDHVAFADIAEAWGTSANAQGLGFQFGSSVHPQRRGYGHMARILFYALSHAPAVY